MRTLSVLSGLLCEAAWYPFGGDHMRVAVSPNAEASSFLESESKAQEEPDRTQDMLDLSKQIADADATTKIQIAELRGEADQHVQKVLAAKQEAENTKEKVVEQQSAVTASMADVVQELTKAQQQVEGLQNDEVTNKDTQTGWIDLLRSDAANTVTSMQAKGFAALQQMTGSFDVSALMAEATIKKTEEDTKNELSKTKVATEELSDKLANDISQYRSSSGDWLADVADNNAELQTPLSDLAQLQKDSLREADSKVTGLFKKIKDEIDTEDGNMDPKKSLKQIKKDGKKATKAAEELVDDAHDSYEEVVDDSDDFTKDLEKTVSKEASTISNEASKGADMRAKETKQGAQEVTDLGTDIEDFMDAVQDNAAQVSEWLTQMGNTVTQRATDYATQQQAVFTAAQQQGDKTVKEVQNDVDAAEAEMYSENGQQAAVLADDMHKQVQHTEDLAQEVTMSTSQELGEVVSSVQQTRALVASAANDAAELDADLEAANMGIEGTSKAANIAGAKAVTDMHNSLSALQMERSITEQSFDTTTKGNLDSFTTHLGGATAKLEAPIKRQSEELNRELAAKNSEMTLHDNALFQNLQNEYVKTIDQMRAKGIDVTPSGQAPSSEVPGMIEKLGGEIDQATAEKDSQAKTVEFLPITTAQKTKMATREIEEGARDDIQQIENQETTMMRQLEQSTYDKIAGESRELAQVEGLSKANDDANAAQSEYMQKLIAEENLGIDEFTTQHQAALDKVHEALADISDARLPHFAETASAAAAGTQEKAQAALSSGEAKFASMLKEDGMLLDAAAKKSGEEVISAVTQQQAEIEKSFTSQEDEERARVEAVEKAGEQMKEETDGEYGKYERKIVAVEEMASEAQQQAQLISAENEQRSQRMTDDVEALQSQVGRQVENSLDHVKMTSEEEVNSAGKTLHEDTDLLSEAANDIVSGAGNEITKTSGTYNTLSKEVSSEEESVRSKAGSLNEAMTDEVTSVEENVEKEDEELHDSEEHVDQDLKTQETQFKGSAARNSQLLGMIDSSATDITLQAKEKMVSLQAGMDAETKAIKGQIDTSFDSAKMTAESAEQSIEESKIELDRSRDDLVMEMRGINSELNRKANETQEAINTFKKLVKTESDMLTKNTGYLGAYKLTTESGIYDLLQQVEGSIGNAAAKAQEKFKKVDDREKAIKDGITSLMGGEAYSTLKKIMDADNYVQQATIENGELVTSVDEFKKQQLKYMSALVQTLIDSKYALILSEREVQMEQDAIDADSSALTGNVIASITNMITGEGGDGESAQLEGMTGSTLQTLLEKAKTGTAQDKEQLQFLLKKIAENGTGGLAHLKNAQQLISAIHTALNGNGNYELMKQDLERVMAFNQKLLDNERKRMEERGIALSDSLFFGGDVGHVRTPRGYEHVPLMTQNAYKREARDMVQSSYSRDAFLERQRKYVEESTAAARAALMGLKSKTPQEEQKAADVSVLLQQNEQLMKENQDLQNEHDEIGREIQDVRGKLQKGKAVTQSP